METTNASQAARVDGETFWALADRHKADVRRIRERHRHRRLRYLLYANVLVLAYVIKRLVEDRPIHFGLPDLGPDAMLWLFPLLLLILFAAVLFLPLLNGRSPGIRFSPEEIGIGFKDVRGIDLVLEEVVRTLQIFLAYKTFREDLGGNPRRGILFEGKPGTGKTHLAKAMACEAGVPFFYVSAPSLHSMWYGMTAWKIRSFFKTLKKAARKEGGAIGFLEEIDAVGHSRDSFSAAAFPQPSWVNRMVSSGTGGMVNELLIQLQSFDTPSLGTRIKNRLIELINLFLPVERSIRKRAIPYNNILVIGATNRAEALDPALLRPGRFDQKLYFDLPSRAGRRDLIDYFLTRRAHASEMDREDVREELASMTLGYTPAMLEHILDEALVWAIREGRKQLTWRDVQRARLSDEIGLGQPVAYSEREREIIATHEAGHAVAAYLCAKDQRKLEVLSIIKRRSALGLLAHSDLEERFTKTRSELEATLKIAFGGMCAEHAFFGESGTGSSSDLVAATELAAQMVGSFGMGSSLLSYEAAHNSTHSDPNLVAKLLSDESTKQEVEDLLRRQKDEVAYLLERNRDLVEALRDALIEHDELMGDEIATVIETTIEKRNSAAASSQALEQV